MIQAAFYEAFYDHQEMFERAGLTCRTSRKSMDRRPEHDSDFRKVLSLIRAEKLENLRDLPQFSEVLPRIENDVQPPLQPSAVPSGTHWFAALKSVPVKVIQVIRELPEGVHRVENAEDLRSSQLLAGDGSIILPEREDDMPEGVKRHNSAKNDPAKKRQTKTQRASSDEPDVDAQPGYLSCRRKVKQKFRRDHPARKNSH